jgi:hypothetical protein
MARSGGLRSVPELVYMCAAATVSPGGSAHLCTGTGSLPPDHLAMAGRMVATTFRAAQFDLSSMRL